MDIDNNERNERIWEGDARIHHEATFARHISTLRQKVLSARWTVSLVFGLSQRHCFLSFGTILAIVLLCRHGVVLTPLGVGCHTLLAPKLRHDGVLGDPTRVLLHKEV